MRNLILISVLFFMASSCSRIQFKEVNVTDPQKSSGPVAQKPTPTYFLQKSISLRSTQEQFSQDLAVDNKIEVLFSVFDSEGFNLSQIKKEDLLVTENNSPVTDFNLHVDQQNIGKKVDLVIVLDVTNSMEETILLVKEKIAGFVKALEEKKWNSTLCLVTFRDKTVETCHRLVEDDPTTIENENLNYFLGELAKAKTKPSGDWDENQLRGLIDAAEKTPWRNNAQRVQVLMTNSTFSYAPNNKGDAGEAAPTYEETLKVLKRKQIQVFSVAPSAAGYSREFSSGWPALHQARGGAYFSYGKMLSGKVPLDQIFQSILDRLSTEYRLTYSTESNALDPEMSMDQRQIQILVKYDPSAQVFQLQQNADWPQGRPELKKKWRLKSQALKKSTIKVFINKTAISSNDYVLENSELQFKKAPKSQSVIQVEYDSANFKDLFETSQFEIHSVTDLKKAKWSINQLPISSEKMNLSQAQDRWSVDLKNLTESDLFELNIYPTRMLDLKIESDQPLRELTQP